MEPHSKGCQSLRDWLCWGFASTSVVCCIALAATCGFADERLWSLDDCPSGLAREAEYAD